MVFEASPMVILPENAAPMFKISLSVAGGEVRSDIAVPP